MSPELIRRGLLGSAATIEVVATSRATTTDEDPASLRFLGCFARRAVVVDPRSHVIYQTEDASGPSGLFYRWLPPIDFEGGKGALRELALSAGGDTAGTLQAMRCRLGGSHVPDLSLATRPGIRYQVEWVVVPDRDAKGTSVREQLSDDDVTRSRKLESAWWGRGGAYFVAGSARITDGSALEHDGQVWLYDPTTETVTLKTIFGVNRDLDRVGASRSDLADAATGGVR